MKNFTIIFLAFFSCSLLFSQNPVVSTLTDEFPGSGGVKLGPDGYLYVANFGDDLSNANGTQVWRIDPATGTRTVFATGLQGASGNDFDSQGNLFQSNIAGGRVSKITPAGVVSTFENVGIVGPVGIAVDDDDNLIVCNCGNNTLRKVTADGVSSLFSSNSIYNCPNGITRDHAGNFYVANFGNGTIVKVAPDGMPSFFVNIPGNNNGHLTYYAPDSMLYVNSHGSSSIYRVTLEGDVTKIAGTGVRGNDDGPALSATFSRPNGIALSVTGDTLWVNSSIPTVDDPANNIRPLNPSVVRMITGLKNMTSHTGEHLNQNIPTVSLSPNPASGYMVVKIDIPVVNALELKIFNAAGNLMQSKNYGQKPTGLFVDEINLEGFSAGIYFLTMMGEGFSVNRQFVVE